MEKQLKETKQTFGKAILTLVERVKTLEVALKRKTKRILLSDSEEEETEAQGRKFHDLDPLVSLLQELVTPSKTPSKTINASGEEQVEDISPTTLEAAAILTKVKKIKSVDKGKRYKRRKSSKESAGTGLDFEEVKSAFEEVNTGSIKVKLDIESINDGSNRGRREGKAPMTEEEETQASKKTKEQILQEEAGLAEAIRIKGMLKRKKLQKEQKKRKAQVQFEAQSYTEEDWDTIRAKLEANAELRENVLGKDLSVEDYAKRMVELNLEATKESLKRFGEELQTKTAKKLKFDDESTQPTEEKVEEDKDDKPTKKTGKRRKQIARKGLHTDLDKDDSEDSDEASEKDDSTSGTKIPINPVPVAIKSPSIANYKIIKQGRKGVYQIVRENGTDMVYISFGAMLTDISRDDLTELYRIVMRKHGMNEPEDEFEKVLWEYLKNMFEEPLSTDSIWSLPGQQRLICWRYYEACRVHCLNLESVDIYMLIERKYPLSAEVCKAMLDKKLQGGKPDEDCYKLLKMMEKQAGIRKHKDWLVQEQTALGKDFSNPLMADNLPKIVWLSTHHIITSTKVVPTKETSTKSVATPSRGILVYSRRPKATRSVGSSSKVKIVESKTSNSKEPKQSWGSTVFDVPSSSLNDCRLSKLFSGAVRFGNDHIAKIMGYEDYQMGNVTISRVYYVEGLVRGLPKLKYQNDHLCSACALGKSKKHSHKPKAEDSIHEKLYLLHMDLCGPMRVQSINGRKYILVIVDDFSRFTWVKFLRSKDEVPEFVIKFLKTIHVRLNATVHNIGTDNGTEFVNQT
ncbi:retrovirus-related pol polyprotein from transposon TNT 1-94 [Tanacetum coccineum]